MFDKFTVDLNKVPSQIRDIVILKGTWFDMGYQFGLTQKEAIELNILQAGAITARFRGNVESFYGKECGLYLEKINTQFPQLIDYWKGIAESTKLRFENIVMADVAVLPWAPECSTVSCWGEATKEGNLITGANADGLYKTNQYYPTIIAYPEDGNRFIAPLGLLTNTYFNEKGLVCMASAGQTENDPMEISSPIFSANLFAAAYCSTAKEALDFFLNKFTVFAGDNSHFVDITGDAYIVERTTKKYEVRRSGDFGEKNYLIATNDFITEKMKCESMDIVENNSSKYRRDSEAQFILDNYGQNDINTIRKALANTKYYKDNQWIDDWEIETSDWMPDYKGFDYKTYSRNIIDVKNQNIYIMDGSSNVIISNIPNALGTSFKINLAESPIGIANQAMEDLKIELWDAEKELSLSDNKSENAMQYLNKAKACIYSGKNYLNYAMSSNDNNERMIYLSKAVTRYCHGQCYAKVAQKDRALLK